MHHFVLRRYGEWWQAFRRCRPRGLYRGLYQLSFMLSTGNAALKHCFMRHRFRGYVIADCGFRSPAPGDNHGGAHSSGLHCSPSDGHHLDATAHIFLLPSRFGILMQLERHAMRIGSHLPSASKRDRVVVNYAVAANSGERERTISWGQIYTINQQGFGCR